MIQSGGLSGKFLGPVLKTRLPIIKNVITPLAKSVFIPIGLTAPTSAALAIHAGIHNKILGSSDRHHSSSAWNNTTLIISNKEMKDLY